MNLQHIRSLIEQGDTPNALKAMLNLLNEGAGRNKRLRDDVIILSNQLQELKRKENIGTLELDEARHQYAQVNAALLNLIDEIESAPPQTQGVQDAPEQAQTPQAPPVPAASGRRRHWLWLLLLLIPAAILGVFRNQFSACNQGEVDDPPGGKTPEQTSQPSALVIQPGPVSRFSYENGACQAPCEIKFNNDSKYADQYAWDFGDGNTSIEQQPKHLYHQTGQFTVRLIAVKAEKRDTSFQKVQIGAARSNTPAIVLPKAAFQSSPSKCNAPCNIAFTNASTHATRYKWFVNSTPAGTSKHLNYRFDKPGHYDVRLVAMNSDGSDSYSQQVQVDETPGDITASFTADKTTCEAPCTVRFSNRSQNAERFEWAITGRTVSTERDLNYPFRSEGTFTVRLTAYRGAESRFNQMVINITGAERPMTVRFTADKTTCQAPCTVRFTNGSLNAERFEWTINGRAVSTERDLNYPFRSEGTFTVRLTVYRGTESRFNQMDIIIPGAERPLTAGFVSDKTTCQAPCAIRFANRSLNAERFEWAINGRAVSTERHLNYTFRSDGTFTVRLTAYRGSASEYHQETIQIVAAPPPQPDLREDCIAFNPSRLSITPENRIVDNNSSLFSFPNRAEAEKTLAIIKQYGFTKTCYVGRPGPSFRYLLSGASSPRGSFTGEDCLRFNPAQLSVVQEGTGYYMTDGSSRMLMFPNKTEADQTLAIIRKYGFTYQCFVGRPDASFEYMRK